MNHILRSTSATSAFDYALLSRYRSPADHSAAWLSGGASAGGTMKRREFLSAAILATGAAALGLWPKGAHASPDQEANQDPSRIRRVLVTFMCHFDVGYTDTQANVVRKYFDQYYPQAMQVAAAMHESGEDRYVWTTGSWLLYQYLEQATSEQRKRMEQAVAAGQIAWHALPFNWQTEFLDRSMILGAMGLSQSLDQRFGRKTIGAKMADVPSHSRGLIRPLAESGVTLLHIGVNPGSPSPEVPPVFVWKDPAGAELTMLYSRRFYGELWRYRIRISRFPLRLHGDNRGPHTIDELKKIYADLRSRYPMRRSRLPTSATSLRLSTSSAINFRL